MSNFDLVWVYVNTRPRLRAHMPGRASQHAPPSPTVDGSVDAHVALRLGLQRLCSAVRTAERAPLLAS